MRVERQPSRRAARRDSGERLTGLHPIREALCARRRALLGLHVRAKARHPAVEELAGRARELGVPVWEVGDTDAERLAPPGVELEVGALPELALADLIAELRQGGRLVESADAQRAAGERRRAPAKATPDARTLVALDGVEDPQNLGAIARVAESAGVAGLVLTRRHAPPLSAAVSRASAGAIEWLPVARVPNLSRALELLQAKGFWTLGADARAEHSLYDLPDRLAAADRVVVLGAEGRGLRDGVTRRIDRMLRIPLGGRVDSLNVSTAAAILLFELRRRSVKAG